MKNEDDDRPKKKVTHEIGQDLYALSADELHERIEALGAEIERLRTDMAKKKNSRDIAADLFKS